MFRAQREALKDRDSEGNEKEVVPEKDRVNLMGVGVYDQEYYSGEKSKFEGYHTSLPTADEVRQGNNFSLDKQFK